MSPPGSSTTRGWAAVATAPAEAMAELMAAAASVVPLPYVDASMVAKMFEYEGMPPGTPGVQTVTRSWGMSPVVSIGGGVRSSPRRS